MMYNIRSRYVHEFKSEGTTAEGYPIVYKGE